MKMLDNRATRKKSLEAGERAKQEAVSAEKEIAKNKLKRRAFGRR